MPYPATDQRTTRVWPLAMLAWTLALQAPAGSGAAQPAGMPPELEAVGVDEKLGAQLPLDATFLDHEGKRVRLGDYFRSERPVLLNLVYHSCPVLCSMVLQATIDGLSQVPWSAGQEFDVISLSIDPRDTPESAADKRAQLLDKYTRPTARKGWHFLVGEEAEIRRVADAVGFRYRYDERQQEYGHAAVVMLVTPEAKLARYLYGLQFDPRDLRIGLLEASEGRAISTVEKVILYCYRYDPQGAKYVLVAWRIMRVGGAVTALALGAFLAVMWRREVRRRRQGTEGSSQTRSNDVAASNLKRKPATARS